MKCEESTRYYIERFHFSLYYPIPCDTLMGSLLIFFQQLKMLRICIYVNIGFPVACGKVIKQRLVFFVNDEYNILVPTTI